MTDFKVGDRVRLLTWKEVNDRFKNSNYYIKEEDKYYFNDGCGYNGEFFLNSVEDRIFIIEDVVGKKGVRHYNPFAWVYNIEYKFPISLKLLVKIPTKLKYINKGK